MQGAVAIIYHGDGRQERVGILLSQQTVEPIGSQVFRKILGYAGMGEQEALACFTNTAKQNGYSIKYKDGSDYAEVTLLDTVLI